MKFRVKSKEQIMAITNRYEVYGPDDRITRGGSRLFAARMFKYCGKVCNFEKLPNGMGYKDLKERWCWNEEWLMPVNPICLGGE
jgi:hypothetical protein